MATRPRRERSCLPPKCGAGHLPGEPRRRRTWDELRAALLDAIRTRDAKRRVMTAALDHSALSSFAEPDSLLAFLTSRGTDADAKDAAYRALVLLCRAEPAQALWSSFIWLGLWPGLEGAYFACLRRERRPADEIISDLTGTLFDEIHKIDLSGVQRLASTLVWNVGRNLTRTYMRLRAADKVHSPIEQHAAHLADPAEVTPSDRPQKFLNRGELPITADDLNLIARVVAQEESQRDIAVELGLASATVRKRYQRALKKLQRHIRKKVCPTWRGPMASTSRRRNSP